MPGFPEIYGDINIKSDASDEDIERLRQAVNLLCPVLDDLRKPLDVCVYLRCHGITAETAIFDAKRQSAGEALLAKARELKCDRLIVGGYCRPKIRDVIMGGVTGYLLEQADMPVILVH